MANVINMGGGGINLIKGTVPAGYRVVYSDGYDLQDETTESSKEISVLGNSLIYTPYASVSPSTPTNERFWSLVDKDFVVQSPYKPNFADNSWENIIEACQRKLVPESWVVGDTKPISLSVVRTNSEPVTKTYMVTILGRNHDTYADGSGIAPITLGFWVSDYDLDMYKAEADDYTWENSYLRSVEIPSWISYFPSVVRNALREVSKVTGVQSTSSTKTLTEKLFIPSEIEYYGKTTYSISGEGSQYDYFYSLLVLGKISSLQYTWSRSPAAKYTGNFVRIGFEGAPGHISATAYNARESVFFAFCL